jgi:hypothetical protein
MIIALDFDGTYTEDPKLWDNFIYEVKLLGHTVLCVTMRYKETESQDVLAALNGKVDRIVFTERIAKAEKLKSLGIKPDIWIDDNPYWIFQNSI